MITINDIVLIHIENSPIFFARIENIFPDLKKDWFQVKLLILNIPLKAITWILKEEYMNGEEFYMNQQSVRIEKIICPEEDFDDSFSEQKNQKSKTTFKKKAKKSSTSQIISFADLKKNK